MSGVPVLRIQQRYLELVQRGEKRLEIRVGYPQVQKLSAGQVICLQSSRASCQVKIKAIRKYRTFAAVIDGEDVTLIAPCSALDILIGLRQLYPEDVVCRYGVTVLEIEVQDALD